MIEITQIRTKQKKNPDTKTTYYPGETTTEIITEREYNLTTDVQAVKNTRSARILAEVIGL